MKMPSNSQHSFARVPQANIQRSQFRSPYTNKFDFSAGYLVPFMVDEVLPGDTFNDKFSMFGRLATPIKPILDNLYLDTFFFFVPNRLLWDNWERFNGAQDNPDDPTDFLVPQCPAPAVSGFAYNSLQDYMGIPPAITGFSHNSFHTRAYNLIWNDFFRDQNLQDSVVVDKDDGPDDPADYVLLRRGKRHDYFTSCLPFPQKGPAASLAFAGNAPVTGVGTTSLVNNPIANVYETGTVGTQTYAHGRTSANGMVFETDAGGVPSIYADLSAVSAFTINEFRQAFQLQMLLEMDARGGTRYVEIIKAHYNVVSPDFRLQRPEYLGGSSTPITITQVAQQGATATIWDTPQGNLAAYGTVTNTRDGYVKSFVEHGVIIALLSVRADLTYQQGLRRMWSRRTRYDFYWPALANLGEMAVLNKEIYLKGSAAPAWDDMVFGYQEAWADYRYHPSLICGQLRSDAPQSLDIWHVSQDLVDPVLGDEFIEDKPPIDRISAVTDPIEPNMIIDIFGQLTRARPMPLFSTPGLITRL
nr:MAG: major capsid protein [Microvirus sp.]